MGQEGGAAATAPDSRSQGNRETVNSSSGGGDKRNFHQGNRSRGFMSQQKQGNRYEGDEIIALFRHVLMA